MKKTSKNSGAKGTADKYFDKHYRDKNGKVLWDKIREAIVRKGAKPIPIREIFKRHRKKRTTQQKKKDNNPPA